MYHNLSVPLKSSGTSNRDRHFLDMKFRKSFVTIFCILSLVLTLSTAHSDGQSKEIFPMRANEWNGYEDIFPLWRNLKLRKYLLHNSKFLIVIHFNKI